MTAKEFIQQKMGENIDFNLTAKVKGTQILDWMEEYAQSKAEKLPIHNVMPHFSKQDVIECLKQRDKEAFDNEFHKYEHKEIKAAIDIINRLMPPDNFPNGA